LAAVADQFGIDALTVANRFRRAGVAVRARRGWTPRVHFEQERRRALPGARHGLRYRSSRESEIRSRPKANYGLAMVTARSSRSLVLAVWLGHSFNEILQRPQVSSLPTQEVHEGRAEDLAHKRREHDLEVTPKNAAVRP
jgi:hypothetical protein